MLKKGNSATHSLRVSEQSRWLLAKKKFRRNEEKGYSNRKLVILSAATERAECLKLFGELKQRRGETFKKKNRPAIFKWFKFWTSDDLRRFPFHKLIIIILFGVQTGCNSLGNHWKRLRCRAERLPATLPSVQRETNHDLLWVENN